MRLVGGEFRAQLGESPVWSEEDATLYFVDVTAPALCSVDPGPGGGAVKVVPLAHRLGCVVPSSKGGFLAAMAVQSTDHSGGRLVRITPQEGGAGAAAAAAGADGASSVTVGEVACDVLKGQVPDEPKQCLNDGKCDARGRVWVGSKVLGAVPDAAYIPVDGGGGALRPNPEAPPVAALFCCEQAFSFGEGGVMRAVGAAYKVLEVGGRAP